MYFSALAPCALDHTYHGLLETIKYKNICEIMWHLGLADNTIIKSTIQPLFGNCRNSLVQSKYWI